MSGIIVTVVVAVPTDCVVVLVVVSQQTAEILVEVNVEVVV